MKVGIMQPYYFPYIGYWQLMNAVDKYVIYDDVNFIKGGWINRNRILVHGDVKFINIQMKGASPNKLINEIGVDNNSQITNKCLRMVQAAYQKAPYFQEAMPIIQDIATYQETNLALFLKNSICEIARYIGIDTEFILSSELMKDNHLHGQEKVINICKNLGADEYYNAIGGLELYSAEKI